MTKNKRGHPVITRHPILNIADSVSFFLRHHPEHLLAGHTLDSNGWLDCTWRFGANFESFALGIQFFKPMQIIFTWSCP